MSETIPGIPVERFKKRLAGAGKQLARSLDKDEDVIAVVAHYSLKMLWFLYGAFADKPEDFPDFVAEHAREIMKEIPDARNPPKGGLLH